MSSPQKQPDPDDQKDMDGNTIGKRMVVDCEILSPPNITKCPDCKGHFSKQHLENHKCQKKPPCRIFKCACGWIGTEEQATTHECGARGAGPPIDPSMTSFPFPCDKCTEAFETYPLLNSHIQDKHPVGCCD